MIALIERTPRSRQHRCGHMINEPRERLTDEQMFGAATCAALDRFADEAPELTEEQARLLQPLFQPDPGGARGAA